MISRNKATINLKALANNLEIACSYANNRKVVAVIKANAYGHGLISAAEALQAADIYGVTDVDEADKLAASSTNKPILILQGIIERGDISRIAKAGYQVVIHHIDQLAWLEEDLRKINLSRPLSFWLKINSGMGRLGITPTDYVSAFQNLQSKVWCKEVIMMSHFANASLINSALNQQQLATFSNFTQQLPKVVTSISASAALLTGLDIGTDWVRPGIMLYGSSPFSHSDPKLRREAFGLQAVMTLQSKIISIQNCKAGDNIGYNSKFICSQNMRIGIVSIGYADGYPSTAPNGTPVLVNGNRTGIVGRVSMDMISIDLSQLPEAHIGDTVTLWGDDLSLDEVAENTDIISHNLTSTISPRVEKVYSN
ncbi:MAG: alanine racemase [Pseudohongiellaceae bacterium]